MEGLNKCNCTMISVIDSKICPDRIYVISFYKSPDIKFKTNHWRDFFSQIDHITLNAQTFILGDFNSQNKSWSSSVNNPSGCSLDGFLFESPFYLLNNGMGTRISASNNYKSVPDLSLTNAHSIIAKWEIEEDPRGSDHYPIVIKLTGKTVSYSETRFDISARRSRPKLALGSFDCKSFPEIVKLKLESLPVKLESEDPLNDWYNIIIDSTLQAGAILYDGRGYKKNFLNNSINTVPCNNSKNPIKHKMNPWWDKECSDSVNKRKLSFKNFIRNPSRESLIEYRRISQCGETRRKLNKKKRTSFRNFVDSLDPYRGPSKFWNTINSFRNSHVFVDSNTLTLTNRQEVLDRYISRLTPDGMAPYLEDCIGGYYPSYFDSKINILELKEIINSLKTKSSPGPDMISNTILKLIPDPGLICLLEIFYLILKGRYYPKL